MASVASSAAPSPSQPPQPTYTFSFTPYLRNNALAALASTVPACLEYTSTGHCPRGRRCPNRHPTKDQQPSSHGHFSRHYQNDNYVCKHWLKGLCKKGDACDYLHEYNLRKMSECQFFNQNGYCQNGDECLYVHVKEGSKLPMCEDYNKGFCEKGPRCPNRHVRRKICEFYLAGFCPEGRECRHGVHLKSGAAAVAAGEREAEEVKRRERVAELERREEENRERGGWRGRGGGNRGRGGWKKRGDRDRR